MRPGEAEGELAGARCAVALRLGKAVLGGPGNSKGVNEAVVERLAPAGAQALDRAREVGFRQSVRPQQGRLRGRHSLSERPEGWQHLTDRRPGEIMGNGAIRSRRAG